MKERTGAPGGQEEVPGREALGPWQREQAGNGACVHGPEQVAFVTKGSPGGAASFQLGNNSRGEDAHVGTRARAESGKSLLWDTVRKALRHSLTSAL